MMHRLKLTLLAAVALFALSSAVAQQPPNVILLMGDDHAWDEVGYNGHPHLKTPVLDEMAADGLTMDRFYSASPVCSPTRGSVLTGRHPNRYGVFAANWSIRPEEITIGHVLQKAGYSTGHFGKWHIGPVKADSPTSPGAMGFDEWLSHDNFFELDPVFSRNGGPPEQFKGESSEILIDETIRFIRGAQEREQPFLAVVWFGSPHEPYLGLPEDVALYENLPEEYADRTVKVTDVSNGERINLDLRSVLQHRYAEITAMDRAIGNLRDFLKENDLRDNTIVWYFGDNGIPSSGAAESPLRGLKGSVYEGGILVPSVLEWPAMISKPRRSDLNTVTSDILPTLAELAHQNTAERPLDGISLVPLLENRSLERESPIYFWHYDQRAEKAIDRKPYIPVELQEGTTPLLKKLQGKYTRTFENYHHPVIRESDFGGQKAVLGNQYKLVVDAEESGQVQLFDLQQDPSETTDLAAEQPEVVGKMQQQLDHWQKSVLNSLTGADYRPATQRVRGWTILSDDDEKAEAIIRRAADYDINHLQLSHHIVHDLREVKDDVRKDQVNRLTDLAHEAGIREVAVWDHALYDLEYYPEQFRDGPGGTINLDNPEFWAWFKADYRDMLDRVPNIDALILTFIETGARAELQHSNHLKTNSEKLAAVVNAVADVVIGERGLELYARTFAYSDEEYANIVGAVDLFERPEIRLMMKESPHDFFLTHPDNEKVGTINRPTLIEFDAAGEYSGQGVVINTWPEFFLDRWRSFAERPNVMGYVARVDRYGDTSIIGRPGEINLLALRSVVENPHVNAEEVYDAFITQRYGSEALPQIKAAFKLAHEVVTSSLYTLGTSMTRHSRLNYGPYASSYVRHVSGKWMDEPTLWVGHGLNREIHYWKDLVTHLAPAFAKSPEFSQWKELPDIVETGWVKPGELMNEEWLKAIVTEKNHGVALAEEALALIESIETDVSTADFQDLYHTFARTLLTARLQRAIASAYFGFRVYCRGESYQTDYVLQVTESGLEEASDVANIIRHYPVPPPEGQWSWREDADRADEYVRLITVDGWPATSQGIPNPNAGMTFRILGSE